MKRRNFIRNITAASAAPILLNGLPVSAFATPMMMSMMNCQGIDERVMVIIFLKGGNDGINTLVPINQYDTYSNLRPDIRLNETGADGILNLDTNLAIEDQIGLHPNMSAFKSMYESGKASIVQGIGYPSINQSHFKSTDLWLSGGDGTPQNFNLQSGWMGRYIENAFPNIHGSPSSQFPDPLGIQLGDPKPSIGFHNHASEYLASNLGWQYPGDISGLLNGLGTAQHQTMIDSDFGKELEYIMNVENNTNAYGARISEVFNAGNNSAVTYPDSGLAYQLSSVARMLAGGSKTKVFLIHTYGFDTHAGQVQAGATHNGNHAELLTDLFESIKVFNEDLTNLGLEEKVVTTTFSEFGRRVTQNGSLGTDHGLLAPMFLFGSSITPGVTGTNVNLSNLTDNGNLIEDPQHDYRSVFKTLLQDWLGADETIISNAGFDNYPKISELVNSSARVEPQCYIAPLAPLPLVLETFEVEKTGASEAMISWTTNSEQSLDKFEIEKSKNGLDFILLGTELPINDFDSEQHYRMKDENPFIGITYYRLKSVDLDQTVNYSQVHSLLFENELFENVKLYPNPATYDTNLVATSKINEAVEVNIFDIASRPVRSTNWDLKPGFNKTNFNIVDLAAGTYMVQIKGSKIGCQSIRLLVQNK